MEASRMEREALDLVASGQTLNHDGAKLLLGWLQRAPTNHPDRAFVKAAADRYYAEQPGSDAPVQNRDTFFIAPAGGSSTTRGMRGER